MAHLGKIDNVDFAIHLSKKANEANLQINVTKLQKLLYICYGLYLADTNSQLLHERPEAWQYGPFFPSVHAVQIKNKNGLHDLENKSSPDDLRQYDYIIDPILGHFGKWTAGGLVAWTHEKGSAWYIKYHVENRKMTPLDNLDIISDFKKFIVSGVPVDAEPV